MKITKRQLKKLIREFFQSYSETPALGDRVVNVNPSCPHYKSKGVVKSVKSLPKERGKIVFYVTTNSGDNWAEGDTLEKTLDQLEHDYL